MDFNREEAEKQRRMMEGSPPTPRYRYRWKIIRNLNRLTVPVISTGK